MKDAYCIYVYKNCNFSFLIGDNIADCMGRSRYYFNLTWYVTDTQTFCA